MCADKAAVQEDAGVKAQYLLASEMLSLATEGLEVSLLPSFRFPLPGSCVFPWIRNPTHDDSS